jgi:hypothetical protein
VAERPKTDSVVEAYPLDEDLVVYDGETREGYLLNGTAADIWQLVDGSRTLSTVARTISRRYGLPYQSALEDVEAFVGELKHAGLLRGSQKKPCGPCD